MSFSKKTRIQNQLFELLSKPVIGVNTPFNLIEIQAYLKGILAEIVSKTLIVAPRLHDYDVKFY